MSTMMMATGAAPATVPAAPVTAAPTALKLVTETPVASVPEDVTFFDDHPLVPVFAIGAISAALALLTVGSIIFWLAIRYSGVLAP